MDLSASTQTAPEMTLPSSEETGKLGIMHLKRFLHKTLLKRMNKPLGLADEDKEWELDRTVLSVLGIGLEQGMSYVYSKTPRFDEFEEWIISTAGMPEKEKVERFNNSITNLLSVDDDIPVLLTNDELQFWEDQGYIIIRNAVPKEDCDIIIEKLCHFIGIDRDDPTTWYSGHDARQGIMVQMFQDEIMEKNRCAPKIRMAFEQLWQRTDIWHTADRLGFNPPETQHWKFPGSRLHLDCRLDRLPIPFGTQGILYLTDTAADQGAFTLVPGFQHKVEDWLRSLPAGTDPNMLDLHTLGSKPIAANTGDLIIWHQALPHGASPNTSARPRFVQYINYRPTY